MEVRPTRSTVVWIASVSPIFIGFCEEHLVDGNGNDAPAGALGSAYAAGKVHLRHHPAAENVTGCIGVGRHRQRAQCQFAAGLAVEKQVMMLLLARHGWMLSIGG